MKKEGEKIEYNMGVAERLESDKEKCDKVGKADLNVRLILFENDRI